MMKAPFLCGAFFMLPDTKTRNSPTQSIQLTHGGIANRKKKFRALLIFQIRFYLLVHIITLTVEHQIMS